MPKGYASSSLCPEVEIILSFIQMQFDQGKQHILIECFDLIQTYTVLDKGSKQTI